MSNRRISVSAAILLAIAVLAGCFGEKKAPAGTPEERIAAALDPCAEGRGPFAQRICQNQELANLDGEVREALVGELAEVSEAGGQMLVQNEQRWREQMRVACGVIDPEAEPTEAQTQCMENELRARARDAASAVQTIGGYTFQRVELVDATPVTAEAASASGLGEFAPPAIVRDIRFPRIDGPQTPQIQRFNELVAQQPQFRLEDATNENVGYEIVYAGPKIVSVRFNISSDTLGVAHPNNSTKAVTVDMDTGEPITANTVFQAGSGWQDFITERAVSTIAAQFEDWDFYPPQRDVRESATKPHLWLISQEGLTILFSPYSFGGSHAMGDVEVTISWADLAPYLNPDAPQPIGAES